MNRSLLAAALTVTSLAHSLSANAALVDAGIWTIVDNTNPTHADIHGTAFLNASVTKGLDQADALAAAQLINSNARFAESWEVRKLFGNAGAGTDYSGALTAEDAYFSGGTEIIADSGSGAELIYDLMRDPSYTGGLQFWTDPDGDDNANTTRDYLRVNSTGSVVVFQYSSPPPNINTAWFIVSEDISAVPVPAAAWLFGSALLGLGGISRRKQGVA